MGIALHVNIDHVATLRQTRGVSYPDPVWAASLCELAGADGITVHLREDRRHIQDRDVDLLRKTVRGVLNLEMAATPEMVDKAIALRPDIVTLVPERREERTTEGGLDVAGSARLVVQEAVAALHDARIAVSLFIAPDLSQVRAAAQHKVPRIELHTGQYCEETCLLYTSRCPPVQIQAPNKCSTINSFAFTTLSIGFPSSQLNDFPCLFASGRAWPLTAEV